MPVKTGVPNMIPVNNDKMFRYYSPGKKMGARGSGA